MDASSGSDHGVLRAVDCEPVGGQGDASNLLPAAGAPTFTQLYRDHRAFVIRALRRRGVAEHSLDDLAQDVFVTAYFKLHTLHDPAGVRRWLGTIAYYCALRWGRGRRRASAKLDAYAQMAGSDRAETGEALLAHALLRQYLGRLDDHKREVVVLKEAFGMTAQEIAAQLGINPNTVSSRLHAARTQLRGFTKALDPELAPIIEASLNDSLRRDLRRSRSEVTSDLAVLLPAPFLLDGGSANTEPMPTPDATPSVASGWGHFPAIAGISTAAIAGILVLAIPRTGDGEASTRLSGDPRFSAAETVALTSAPGPTAAGVAQPIVVDEGSDKPSVGRRRVARRSNGRKAENRLIHRALEAEASGEFSEALELVRRHAKLFPAGQLIDAAVGIEIRSYCASGRYNRARRVARRHGKRGRKPAADAALASVECQSARISAEPRTARAEN